MSLDPTMIVNPAQQVVTFEIGGQNFCVSASAVREIKGWQATTPMPDAAPHVLGVINLRGQIIAVYDLAQRLGKGKSHPSSASVIIVVEDQRQTIGMLADSISDIFDVRAEELKASPLSEPSDILETLVVRRDEVIPLIRIAAVA